MTFYYIEKNVTDTGKEENIIDRMVKIGLIQFPSILGNIQANITKSITMAENAADRGAKIICFPETFISGFNLNYYKGNISALAEDINGKAISGLRKVAKEKEIYIIAPIILKKGKGNTYSNSAIVIDDTGDVIGTYSKNHLWHLGETDYFQKGNGFPVFKTKYGKVGIMICYDANFPESARTLVLKGAKLIFMPCAWRIQDKDFYDLIIPARACDNQVFIGAVNICSMQEDLNLFGNSKIANPKGKIVAESLKYSEDILIHEVDLTEVDKARIDMPLLRDRRPEQYSIICSKIDNN